MKKVFLDDLPKTNNNQGVYIDWKECIGYKVKFIYDDIKGFLKICDYKSNGNRGYLCLKYKNKIYDIETNNLRHCNLGSILNKITKEFKIEIGTRFKDDNRDITIIDRKYIKFKRIDKLGRKSTENIKYYQYICNKCGFNSKNHYSCKDNIYKDNFWIRESSLLTLKIGCACCHSDVVVENINSIYKTDPWMIPYIGEECAKTHTRRSGDKVNVTCPDCGRIKDKKMIINNIYKYKSIGCICSDSISYPNKFAYELLNQLDKIYKFDYIEQEYSPEWIKPKRYDNYFVYKGKEYIIEMDGGFHENDNLMNGETADESRIKDNFKDRMAKKNGIKVIRINCNYGAVENRFEYIKTNLLSNKELNKLFNFDLIEWNSCNKFAISNLVEIACKLKNSNPNMTTNDIASVMRYSSNTICNWLKQGNGIWCDYDPKKELKRVSHANGKLGNKPIIMLDLNNSYIELFKKAKDIELKYLKVFDIKLNCKSISAVATGIRKTHKGYRFKYIEDLTPEEYIKYGIENKLKELHNRDLGQACQHIKYINKST